MAMSILNLFNKRDYGHFYHIANSASAPTETYLLSYFILSNAKISFAGLALQSYDFPATSFVNADTYTSTGDKLCWGSIN